jgi:RHS repeat-associated protein
VSLPPCNRTRAINCIHCDRYDNRTLGLVETQVAHLAKLAGWADAYTETYGYDAETGFLTSAQYTDDPSWNGSWAYDASGNRTGTGWDYDRLNRMTASPGIQNYVHDMAGNRLWRDHMANSPNVVKMTWDELNRMKSVQGTQDGSVNFYRADGLRARRVTGIGIGFNVDDQGAVSGYYDTYSLDRPTWRYYHDGQAPFEDDVTYDPGSGTRKDVTRYALGARGGDMAEAVLAMGGSGERTVRSYPLYDGHGNTVAQVARADDDAPDASFAPVPGAPAFKLGARRKYDAWGQVRWSEGSPLDQGYCGSLQHRRDAESGLVYMRARYYEPWTGRFLSEDPAMDGANWYVYCTNDPVNRVDPDGETDSVSRAQQTAFLKGLVTGNWQDLVDILEIIATAFGAPVDSGMLSTVLDTLQKVPTPKGGLKQTRLILQDMGCRKMAKNIIEHILRLITDHPYDYKHHLDELRIFTENIYKRSKR